MLLHVASQVVRLEGWHAILQTAYPKAKIRFSIVLQSSFVAAGIGSFIPKGGTPTKLIILKKKIDDSRYPTLVASLVPETLFETVIGISLAVWAVSTGLLDAAIPSLPPLAVAGIALGITALGVLTVRSQRGRKMARQMLAGLSILAQPRRFVARVMVPQAIGRVLKLASIACMLKAFGLPASVEVAALVMTVWGISGFLPGGAAMPVRIAALVGGFAALHIHVSTAAVSSFLVGQGVIFFLVNIGIGFVALATLLDTSSPKVVLTNVKLTLSEVKVFRERKLATRPI